MAGVEDPRSGGPKGDSPPPVEISYPPSVEPGEASSRQVAHAERMPVELTRSSRAQELTPPNPRPILSAP